MEAIAEDNFVLAEDSQPLDISSSRIDSQLEIDDLWKEINHP